MSTDLLHKEKTSIKFVLKKKKKQNFFSSSTDYVTKKPHPNLA